MSETRVTGIPNFVVAIVKSDTFAGRSAKYEMQRGVERHFGPSPEVPEEGKYFVDSCSGVHRRTRGISSPAPVPVSNTSKWDCCLRSCKGGHHAWASALSLCRHLLVLSLSSWS